MSVGIRFFLLELHTNCIVLYGTTLKNVFGEGPVQSCTTQDENQWPSTHVIDEESFLKIASNSWQAEVIAHSTRYQTLWTDKNSARYHSTTKLVLKWTVMTVHSTLAVNRHFACWHNSLTNWIQVFLHHKLLLRHRVAVKSAMTRELEDMLLPKEGCLKCHEG